MINVWIDELTPCLKNSLTGEIEQTKVVCVCRKSFLKKYNRLTGWYVNWADLAKENEIYAIVLKGSVDIQGLIAVSPSEEMGALYISWMVAAPENNRQITEFPKYLGVGGHLFATAAYISKMKGYDGYITGNAANKKLLEHYQKTFSAEYIGIIHPYQFAIDENIAGKIMEVYDIEWTDAKI